MVVAGSVLARLIQEVGDRQDVCQSSGPASMRMHVLVTVHLQQFLR